MIMGRNEEVEVRAQCGCCGISEECTLEYIKRVQERFGGAWVCGLCAEAIKDEQARLGGVGVEAAMLVHAKFMEIASVDPTVRTATSLRRLFKKMSSATANTIGTATSSAKL